MCCAFVHTLLVNSSDESYIVHEKKSFKRCLDYARHDRCKLIYYYIKIKGLRDGDPFQDYESYLSYSTFARTSAMVFTYSITLPLKVSAL